MNLKFNKSELLVLRIFYLLITLEIFIVVVYALNKLVGTPNGLVSNLFNLNGEMNVPALFSSGQLFVVGILFYSLALQAKQKSFSSPLFFFIMGCVFSFLSIDEAFSIHEKITEKFYLIEWIPRFKGNHGIWIFPYILLGIIIFLFSYKNIVKIWNNYRRETQIIFFGLFVFALGGIGLEVLSYQFIGGSNLPGYVKHLEIISEEFMEMSGISIVLCGSLLLRIKQNRKSR